VGILRGAVLRGKGRERKGLKNSGIFKRRCEGIRAKVEISYNYSLITLKIGNKPIN
jgi:hypothetical protein